MKATKIKMKSGCLNSKSCQEIDSVYIIGCQSPGYYKKGQLYDYLDAHPDTISVDGYPYTYLVGAIGPAPNYEKYVRSSPNDTTADNLLSLPRE